jgi:hypothetical protein
MRNYMLGLVLALLVAFGSFISPAMASAEQPFITAAHYKKNISLEKFQGNPRSFFRSEAAFDLIVDYVGDEIGQKLTDAEFVALMRSDQVRTRSCTGSINTGALAGNQFSWFVRKCRPGEEIIQVLVDENDDRWIDVISLNCLNAVEDQTPVIVNVAKRKFVTVPLVPEYRMVRSTTATAVNNSVFLAPFMLPGCPSCCPPAFYGGFSTIASSVDRSTSYIIEEIR